MSPSRLRTFGTWLVLIGVAVAAFVLLQDDPLPVQPWEQFLEDVAEQDVAAYEWTDQGFYEVTTRGGERYQTSGLVDTDLAEALAAEGVYAGYDVGWFGLLGGALVPVVAVVGALVLVFLILRRAQGKAAGQALDLRKSKARLLEAPPATRFSDVGGCEEAKQRLHDVVDFLQHPEVWAQAGARVPRGVLLEGPPGSGKTLLARAVAGEAGVRFFVVSGSEFVEMFVGVGAARVRDLFESATKAAPAVVFIDELDAIGRRRGSGIGHWNEEREQTLNQILVSLDGFETRDRVVVIGATNRSDILDPALVRPGRFDLRLRIPPLEEASRGQVLGIHARGKKLAPGLDLDAWAVRTQGATGAGLEQLLNEAALLAVRRRTERAGLVSIHEADLADAWASMQRQGEGFLPLDQALVDSAWQLARSDGQQRVRVRLVDGQELEGTLLWADGAFLKLRQDDGQELALAKGQVLSVQAPAPAPAGP